MPEKYSIGKRIGDRLRRFQKRLKDHFNHTTTAHNISVIGILAFSFVIRTIPILNGSNPTTNSFDSHMQLRATNYILDHGLFKFLHWYDSFNWYPNGNASGISLFIAVPLTIAIVFKVLTFLGFSITVEFVAHLVPVIYGTIGVYYSYLICKELGYPRRGLDIAMVMAIMPVYVSRSSFGLVDYDSVNILFIVMIFYYIFRAILSNSNKSAIMAGLLMFILAPSWGVFWFAYRVLPIFAVILMITRNVSARFLRSYAITVCVITLVNTFFSFIRSIFLNETDQFTLIGMITFLLLFGVMLYLTKIRSNQIRNKVMGHSDDRSQSNLYPST